MTNVLIVDDQPLQRMGFRMVLETEPGVSVAGEAENGIEAVRRTAELVAGRRADGHPHAGDGRDRGDEADHREPAGAPACWC